MQMLVAGGLEAVTDSLRTPDDDNPLGYFELERVKHLKQDSSWLDEAHGKVIKVIHLLLMDLPIDRDYRVIFMRRDLSEVVRSQATMLDRSGRRGAGLSAERLIELFRGQLRTVDGWLAAHPGFQVLSLEHSTFISDPLGQAKVINAFLGGSLDELAMARAVKPELHRNRSF